MRGAVVDLDGTVYRSTEPIPGAVQGVASLRDSGIDTVFVSNTSSKSRDTCRGRLEQIGIEAALEDVITSASVTATYVAETYPGATVFAIGQPALLDELVAAGVSVTTDPEGAGPVVVGKDRSFDFETLTRALHALDGGGPFVVTNQDRTAPVGDGIEPGTGAIVAAIATATGRDPDVVTGKPHDPMLEAALDRLDVPASDCLVVGDNPESDIAMGARAGMTTVQVRSGIADRSSPAASAVEPDYVVESMAELDRVIDAIGGT